MAKIEQKDKRKPASYFCLHSIVVTWSSRADTFDAGQIWDEYVLGMLPDTIKEKHFVPLSQKRMYRRMGANFVLKPKGLTG